MLTVAGDLTVDAAIKGQIFAISASGSVATNEKGISIAGQVSVNTIATTTASDIDDGSSVTTNDVTLSSNDADSIFAIAGALAYGGKAGIGASISLNFIPFTGDTQSTLSYIQDSDVAATGSVQASSTGDESIFAITAAFGASKKGMAGALAISINTISPTNETYISGKKSSGVHAGGNLTLDADDTATIQAIAGGIGATGGVLGFGLAFGYNAITGTTEAALLNSATIVAKVVDDEAISTPTIQIIAVAGGAAVPDGEGSTAVGAGAAIAINSVTSSVLALINPATVQATSLTLDASSTALIQILAIGAGGALLAGKAGA